MSTALASALAVALSSASALAADALNSSDKAASSTEHKGPRNEFNLLPVAGGTTDIGIGGGYFAGLARLRPGFDPYVWNIESAGLVTFKARANGTIYLPYQDIYVLLTIPRFLDSPLRLEVRPSFSGESTLGYYGIGNASSDAVPPGASPEYNQYGRMHPEIAVDLRERIVDHVAGRVGMRYVQTWLQVGANSKLADDLKNGSPEVKHLLGSTESHATAAFTFGIQFDNRDNEVSTHAGVLQSVDVRLSPGRTSFFPYRYAQALLQTRAFIPIWKPRLTLALRAVADVLEGDPPFYELSRFDNTYALGGLNGVRGIPGQRYYGKVKAFGNAELRAEVLSFHFLGKPMLFGVVGFFDGGRVWADTTPHPELDGRSFGLKYGTGGGLRLQSGTAFVIRADVAYSPDAKPVSGYFSAGQMF